MNGFEIVDRYDIALSLLTGALMGGALLLNAPLWVFALTMVVTSIIVFIRHFDEIMGP